MIWTYFRARSRSCVIALLAKVACAEDRLWCHRASDLDFLSSFLVVRVSLSCHFLRVKLCQCLRCRWDSLFSKSQEYSEIQWSLEYKHALASAISRLLCDSWTRDLEIVLQERAFFSSTSVSSAELQMLFDSCSRSLSILRLLRFEYWKVSCESRWIDWLDQLRRIADAIWHSHFRARSFFSGVSREKLAQSRTSDRRLNQTVIDVNICLFKSWDFSYYSEKLKQCTFILRCYDDQSEDYDKNVRMWWRESENVMTALNDSSI